jgi:hypothetical protein
MSQDLTESQIHSILKPTTSKSTMTSAILTKLSKIYPEVLTEPQKILGPNAPKVLELWRRIDILSEPEMEEIGQRYFALDDYVRNSAWIASRNAAKEVVGREFSGAAWDAVYDVTGRGVFGDATMELIGNVKNKLAYDLIMSHKNL